MTATHWFHVIKLKFFVMNFFMEARHSNAKKNPWCLLNANYTYSSVFRKGLDTLFTVTNFFETFFLSFSVSSQCAGSEVKPLTEDRGCDSVLLGQSNRTPHGAVIDEYGAMVE
jgi:hypothetical protein